MTETMRLRLKVLLSLFGTAVLLMATLHILVERTLLPRFARIEEDSASQARQQAQNALAQRIELLSVSDWARWDDARSFVLGEMPDFQKRNVQENTLVEMQLSVIVYTDLTGKPLLGVAVDPETKKGRDVPASLYTYLKPESKLWDREHLEPRQGLLSLPEGVLMFALAPVTSTDSESPPAGVCFFGQFLTAGEVAALSEATGVELSFLRMSELTPQQQTIAATCLGTPQEVVLRHTNDQLHVYNVVLDAFGRPAMLVQGKLPRSVYLEGVNTISVLSRQSWWAAAVLGAMTFLLFETLVMSRITRFSSQVRNIADTQDLTQRVELYGRDEVAQLAQPVNYLLSSLRDAQTQLELERSALETSEHRLSLALEAAGDGLWDINLRTGDMSFSDTWARMMGYDLSDLPRTVDAFQHLVHPEDVNHLKALTDRHLKGETTDVFAEIRLITAAGLAKWVLVRGRVVKRDAAGVPLRMIGTHQDIDARRLADDELRESRELFRNAFVESATGMAMVAPCGTFLRVNRNFCEIVGYDESELLDLNFQRITHPDDLEEDVALTQELLSNRRDKYAMEKRYVRKDGTTVWALMNVGLVCDSSGVVKYMVAQIQDISRRKTDEAELQAYTQRLFQAKEQLVYRTEELAAKSAEAEAAKHAAEDASRTKSEFLANMSHEIRTPMTAILGYADLLLDESLPATQRGGCVETIRRNGKHLLSIINDILDLSKIEAGKMTVEKIACDPVQIVGEVESLMRVRATEKNLRFTVEHETAIPRSVQTDPTRLRQVLLNLVSNAIKFTHEGDVSVRVRFQPAASGHAAYLRVLVCDTGIGMDQEQVGRLFSAFSQADTSTTRKFGGSGLGLAISMRLAQMMGGNVVVSSTLGQGTRSAVTIDVGEVSDAPLIPPVSTVPTKVESKLPLAGRRILLAEDGVDNQRLVSFYLTRSGATVEVAENGQIALERIDAATLNGQTFDVVLMDMQMPVLDGYAAAGELRRRGSKLPIIALTAHAMDGDRRKCVDAGCSDYLTKPIDRDVLVSTILSWCAGAASDEATPLHSSLETDPMMAELVTTYVQELPGQAAQLTSLMNQQNLADLKRLVHQIKGAGGGYGFDAISDAAAAAEQSMKLAQDLQMVRSQVDALIERIRSVYGYDRTLETDHAAARAAH